MNESTMLRRVAARENGSNLCPTRFGSVERLAISLGGGISLGKSKNIIIGIVGVGVGVGVNVNVSVVL